MIRTILLTWLAGCQTAVSVGLAPAEDPSSDYEELLQRVVTPDGYVRWDGLVRDHAALDAYVAWLAREGAEPDDPTEAHALWLNAYNAWVLKGVLDAGVPASVRDVRSWMVVGGTGFFLGKTWTLDDHQVSLYTAEHSQVRARFKDWRDHAALNCASASCPSLRRELYDASRLNEQLDEQVRRWVNDPVRGVRLGGPELVVSPIFDWYAGDFGDDLCGLLVPYADAPLQRALVGAGAGGCPRSTFDYDWRLNWPESRGT